MTAVTVGAAPQSATNSDVSTQRALLNQYCVVCHNQRLKTANLLLDQLDLDHLADHAETGEKIVRKLRAGLMPPAGMPRPDAARREALVSWMENQLDRGAVSNLDPPGLHRLNRIEYQNAIRDLLALDVDTAKFLPSDNSTHGFDNIAGALTMSPALLEAYLAAAGKISRLALAKPTTATEVAYSVAADETQNYHIEGLPFGTRGGILIKYEFPADGEYAFKITPVAEGNMGQLNYTFGRVNGEQLELLLDGTLLHQYDWDKQMQGFVVRFGLESPRFHVKAGMHSVGVTFVATNYAPGNDLNAPFARTTIDTGALPGFTFYPHVGLVRIEGPFDAKPTSETDSRRRIFVCYPKTQSDENPCARQILGSLIRRAFRRPATPVDVNRLMEFYQSGRNEGSFDDGVEKALRRLLVDPEFIFRGEAGPRTVLAGRSYRINDLALASRLSFFLWSSVPDNELLRVATEGRLHEPAVLEQQTHRMIADPKSAAFVANFTGQWLNLRGLDTISPDPTLYPDFDNNLRQSFRREVELFFTSIMREDRSVLDLLTADYTFVDERLARHYGIANVYGSQFRRVALGPDLDVRRGLLGKGALMAITSQATRTSPVTRGKWFQTTFLGVEPPQPPPGVDTSLKEKVANDASGNLRVPTLRDVLERHHSNPVCASCHKIFEPIGLAFENFDATGAWRTLDENSRIDATAVMIDGTHIDGVVGLREMLLRYKEQFVRVVAEKLLTYALGRGVEYQDMPLVRSIVHEAAHRNYRFSSFVLGIVESESFQRNRKDAVPLAQEAAR